ncbi:thermonuclease family protein [Chloroflexota bacterium]
MKKLFLLTLALFIVSSTLSCVSSIDRTIAQIEADLPEAPSGDTTQATVTRVIDGDTIEVKISGDLYRVRYIGIDTPERNQSGYREANNTNSDLVMGRIVVLEKDVSEVDRYGRLLRYVWVDGYMVNAILVATGYAHDAIYPPDTRYAEVFFHLEQYAKNEKLGLWAPNWKYLWFWKQRSDQGLHGSQGN